MGVIVPADGKHVAIVAKDEAELDSLNRFMRLVGEQDGGIANDEARAHLEPYLNNQRVPKSPTSDFSPTEGPISRATSRTKSVGSA